MSSRLKCQLAVHERQTDKSKKESVVELRWGGGGDPFNGNGNAMQCKKKKSTWKSSCMWHNYYKKAAIKCACTCMYCLSVCLCLLNHVFDSHSCCRLSYRRPSTWTAMSWLCPTTCSYITIPSMGEGLADSTLQKVRLLIWRMVGTFFCILLFAALLHLHLQPHPSFPNTLPFFFPRRHPPKNHTPPSCF